MGEPILISVCDMDLPPDPPVWVQPNPGGEDDYDCGCDCNCPPPDPRTVKEQVLENVSGLLDALTDAGCEIVLDDHRIMVVAPITGYREYLTLVPEPVYLEVQAATFRPPNG